MKWLQIRKRNEDLERELRSDLELEEEEQRDRALPPDEARYAAMRAFGNTTLIREQTHESWGSAPFERFLLDLRFALRQLRRNPGFTFTATIMLALGIGASVSMFAFVDAALFKPLPYLDPGHWSRSLKATGSLTKLLSHIPTISTGSGLTALSASIDIFRGGGGLLVSLLRRSSSG